MLLTPEQGRVIGSLIEKQMTTPQQYPLTLNALTLACNQSSNRDPVVSYDERVVDSALSSLKELGLLRFVHPSHGRSVTRYRQVLEEKLALHQEQLAVLGVLLLRGPQTAGELRARTDRMVDFDGIPSVEAELDGLSRLPEPLVRQLPRRPGQKEERWVQLLADSPEASVYEAAAPVVTVRESREATPARVSADGLAALAGEVADLRGDIAAIRSELEQLRSDLYG